MARAAPKPLSPTIMIFRYRSDHCGFTRGMPARPTFHDVSNSWLELAGFPAAEAKSLGDMDLAVPDSHRWAARKHDRREDTAVLPFAFGLASKNLLQAILPLP